VFYMSTIWFANMFLSSSLRLFIRVLRGAICVVLLLETFRVSFSCGDEILFLFFSWGFILI
jgi:hypothetical protein